MWSKFSGREKGLERSGEPAVPPPARSPSSVKADLGKPDARAKIGKTIIIRGELSGDEDLTIEGRVEGRIELKGHHLVVGEAGIISAEVVAKTVTIIGRMEGNLKAKERAEILESGSIIGDICAPRVVIADGAKFKGSVDMSAEAPAQPPGKGKEKREPDLAKPESEKGLRQPTGVQSGFTS